MIQVLAGMATHTLALVVYPGLLTAVVFGGLVVVCSIMKRQASTVGRSSS